MKATLLDTGVIVALLDRDERHHARCRAALADLGGPLVTCEAVIAEACHLLRRIPGAARSVIDNVAAGVFHTGYRLADRAPKVQRLMEKYHDLPMALADACLVDLADLLGTGRILTLDQDFQVYRWRGRRRFDLLVEPLG